MKAIRDDINAIKSSKPPVAQSEIDDIESLFSSLDNSHLSSSASPFIQLQQPGMLSPPGPSASATAPLFRPRANSLPPIYLEPYLDQNLPASKAQQLRLQSTGTSQPFLVTPVSECQGVSPSIVPGHGSQPQSSGVQVPTSPLLSPPCQSQPTFSMGQPTFSMGSLALIAIRASSQIRAQYKQPLSIPSYLPIKTAEEIVARYPNYLNEDNIGRLATKLARFTYLGLGLGLVTSAQHYNIIIIIFTEKSVLL